MYPLIKQIDSLENPQLTEVEWLQLNNFYLEFDQEKRNAEGFVEIVKQLDLPQEKSAALTKFLNARAALITAMIDWYTDLVVYWEKEGEGILNGDVLQPFVAALLSETESIESLYEKLSWVYKLQEYGMGGFALTLIYTAVTDKYTATNDKKTKSNDELPEKDKILLTRLAEPYLYPGRIVTLQNYITSYKMELWNNIKQFIQKKFPTLAEQHFSTTEDTQNTVCQLNTIAAVRNNSALKLPRDLLVLFEKFIVLDDIEATFQKICRNQDEEKIVFAKVEFAKKIENFKFILKEHWESTGMRLVKFCASSLGRDPNWFNDDKSYEYKFIQLASIFTTKAEQTKLPETMIIVTDTDDQPSMTASNGGK